MAQSAIEALRRTLLHDWHVAANARMVAFGGWHMPVNYPSGVVREHLAARTRAALFDVCHMGRFGIAGHAAERFLARMLTNDAAALAPGRAHYTLLATPSGGAVDDAYLYRLTNDDFLLVVNAANRARDWDWLHADPLPSGVVVTDQSEGLAMFALQGPASADCLRGLVEGDVLPERQRNRLSVGKYHGHALITARTGYTGEAIGFELFVDARVAPQLWQELVDAGAVPAGLGARDSLRLEAGLPLYGHELGIDRAGREIPIFANRLARFGVRKPGNGDYVGVQALDAQRAEYEAIAAATLERAQLLPQLVRPLAVFDGRRPLRAGYDLYLGEEAVGYVTSGSSVPVPGGGESEYTMRPIGLGLVRSDIRFDPAAPVRLTVRDARQALMDAWLVAANLPPPAAP